MKNLLILKTLILIILISCEAPQRDRKPSATGRTSEMIVVTEKKHWEGKPGELIKHTFAAAQPMLPQPESMFDLRHLDENNFSSLFQTHRSILMLNIDASLDTARIETTKNLWAYPQRIVRVFAPDNQALKATLERNSDRIIELFLEKERKRLINAYRRMPNNEVRNFLQTNFDVDIMVPEGYFVAIEGDDFAWIRRTGTKEDLEMGLLISSLPYTNPEKDFDFEVLWERRDSITKKYIAGEIAGSYMTTYSDIPPLYREINFNEKYAAKLRGLWRMEGDFMGGPFLNYTLLDERYMRLINIDVFVWAPDFDKRDYLRQLEALAYSLKFPDKKKNNNDDE